MSTLKADTIQNTSGGAVTLTKADTVKFWTNYDAINQVTKGSLNQSSLTDDSVGSFYSSLTNAMSGAEDKCVNCTAANSQTTGGNGTVAGSGRGIDCYYGTHVTSDIRAFATGEVQFASGYGATANSNGQFQDWVSTNVTVIGDLA